MSRNLSLTKIVILSCALLILGLLAGFSVGSKQIPVEMTISAFTAFDSSNSNHLLVQHLRVPRTLIAALSGAALAVAGLLMQTLTKNPMADAGVLGINAGASLFIVLFIALTGITAIHWHMLAGFGGALFSVVLVTCLGTAGKYFSPLRLILAGVAFSAVFLALTQLVIINSHEQVFEQFRHWSVGSLAGRDSFVFWPLCIVSMVAVIISIPFCRALDAICLGSALAHSVGVRLVTVWVIVLLVVTLLAGAATAAVGPIAFVGLMVPHLSRALVGNKHLHLLLVSLLIGASTLVYADVLGRVLFSPAQVSAGIIMALIGGPCFIYLAQQRYLKVAQ